MKLLKKKSWRIVFMFMVAAVLLIWIAPPAPEQTLNRDIPQANNNTFDVVNEVNPTFQDTGTISILFADNQDGEIQAIETFFTDDEGRMYEIVDDEALEYHQFNGDLVNVTGTLTDTDPNSDADLLELDVDTMTTLQDDMENGVTGNTRWVNIACRFGDMENTTPKPIEYFQDMMINEAPGMDHYWRTTSAQLVNIEGSGAFGWYDLPESKNTYLRLAAANTGNALRKLMNDCVALAIQNDNVDFTQYGGINMMLNDTFGCCAWGGRMGVDVNGQTIQYRTTWLPPWAFDSLHVIAHEMGHGWGLPHSSGPYGKVYDSAWDVMSGGNSNHTDAICRIGNEALGCFQVGTIGFHLAMLGWIPENQMTVVENGSSATFTLDALTTLETSKNMLTVFIPIGNTRTFYTVEVRNFIDYDRNLPGEAVVMHQVVPTRASPAHVVDADNNGNPNDEGAMWRVGETFSDDKNHITMEVVSREDSSFTVRISNNN